MRPIPTPKQVEDRLRTPDTGLRDRVIAALEETTTTRNIVVKVQDARAPELARVADELAKDWKVTSDELGGKKVLILNPKEPPAPKGNAPAGK